MTPTALVWPRKRRCRWCASGARDAHDVVNSLRGSTFFWRGHLVNSPLVGDYNVDNALMAMSIMSALGVGRRRHRVGHERRRRGAGSL